MLHECDQWVALSVRLWNVKYQNERTLRNAWPLVNAYSFRWCAWNRQSLITYSPNSSVTVNRGSSDRDSWFRGEHRVITPEPPVRHFLNTRLQRREYWAPVPTRAGIPTTEISHFHELAAFHHYEFKWNRGYRNAPPSYSVYAILVLLHRRPYGYLVLARDEAQIIHESTPSATLTLYVACQINFEFRSAMSDPPFWISELQP